MVELPRMSLLTVLTLGNQRYCQDGPAEAIMSVVNARDWFLEDRGLGKAPTVLGRSPLAFIQEVWNKLKGHFFGDSRCIL